MRLPKINLYAAVILCCLGCTVAQQQPLRSIQLGGGLRPVAPATNQIPTFSQQLAFGPQFQGQPQGQLQYQAQPQQLQPTYIQRQNTFPATPNAALVGRPQPIPLGIKPATTQASTEEDEYEDEYEDGSPAPAPVQQQQFRGQPQPPQVRPVLQLQQLEVATSPRPIPQRSPLRLATPQQQENLTPVGPPRFQVAQPQLQQIRRPVQPQQPVLQQQPIQRPLQLQQPQQPVRLGQDSRLVTADRQGSTPPPVKTLDRYMRTNDDGSTSWGYTNEDGSFKEETLGVDCVVRGKYGYVDPDGVKREYEYQSGNPCDPNKRGQPDDDEEEPEVTGQQQQRLGGLLAARPVQYQAQPQQFRRPAVQ